MQQLQFGCAVLLVPAGTAAVVELGQVDDVDPHISEHPREARVRQPGRNGVFIPAQKLPRKAVGVCSILWCVLR